MDIITVMLRLPGWTLSAAVKLPFVHIVKAYSRERERERYHILRQRDIVRYVSGHIQHRM